MKNNHTRFYSKKIFNQNDEISRRKFMSRSSLGLGAVGLASSGLLLPTAFAAEANAPSAVVVIFLPGGIDGVRFFAGQNFASAGTFGVTTANTVNLNPNETDPANRLVVDAMFNQLNPFAKEHFAVAGVAHGITAHGPAKAAAFTAQGRSGALALASAIGGSGPIKCAAVGREQPYGSATAVNGVSYQQISDMQSTIDALGGGAPDPTMPKRDLAANAIAESESLAKPTLVGNKDSIITLANGYKVAQASLRKAPQAFNPQELKTAYNLQTTAVDSFMAKMAAAELMINAGTNVVVMVDGGGLQWDTHGDTSGARSRGAFASRIMPGLKLFTDRMVNANSPFNVHVVIMGDFNRSTPGADHAGTTSAAVIGPRIKVGTTGNVDTGVRLAQGTPGTDGLWGLLGQISGGNTVAAAVTSGGNPHTRIVNT